MGAKHPVSINVHEHNVWAHRKSSMCEIEHEFVYDARDIGTMTCSSAWDFRASASPKQCEGLPLGWR